VQIISFKYTKADGSISNRVLAVMVKPNTMFEGIDISELEVADQVMFAEDMNSVYNEYLAKLEEIKQNHDVKHNYRRFDPVKMSEIVNEEI
jgi:hypothetical protein